MADVDVLQLISGLIPEPIGALSDDEAWQMLHGSGSRFSREATSAAPAPASATPNNASAAAPAAVPKVPKTFTLAVAHYDKLVCLCFLLFLY